jgi:hypothetical protein
MKYDQSKPIAGEKISFFGFPKPTTDWKADFFLDFLGLAIKSDFNIHVGVQVSTQ